MRAKALLPIAALAALLLGVAPGSAAAAPTAKAAVVGGTGAQPGSAPWIVAMSRGCGGSLIAPDRVLTAGHCVEDLRVSELRLYLGARKRRRGTLRYDGTPVQAVDVATHPGYRPLRNSGPVNDVAIIRLARPVEGVTPVQLAGPLDVRTFSANRIATVLGWGVTRTDRRDPPLARSLRQGRLRILSDAACHGTYGDDAAYRDAVMICARSRSLRRRPNTSPCVGDSGGPLVGDNGLQIGVVSFGISCGALREPTVFAEVAGLRSFIDQREPIWAPQPLGRPRVTGSIRAGGIATCEAPQWRGDVRRIRYRWGINGILVATGRRVRVTRAARGKILQCRAVAVNAGGTTPSVASSKRRVPR